MGIFVGAACNILGCPSKGVSLSEVVFGPRLENACELILSRSRIEGCYWLICLEMDIGVDFPL